MAVWMSRGIITVTTAGTPVRASNNNGDPTAADGCLSIVFQQVAGNTGRVIIKDPTQATVAELPPPASSGETLPTAVVNQNDRARYPLDLSDYYIDASVNGTQCRVSVVKTT